MIANGKLHISVTSLYSGENVLISNFTSKEELIGVGFRFSSLYDTSINIANVV